jgi:D-arabinose 1-dehydrogenase-like Zn-dependent alcohol dehydrogenase
MRGVVFTGHRKLEIREFPHPSPGPGEVVLQIKASGMCGSDLKYYRPAPGEAQRALGLGNLAEPIIAGHEPCGVVAAVGSGVAEAEARVGMRAMDHHYCGCGVCHHCRLGWSQLCGAGFAVYGVTAHGAHADYMKVPARTLVPLPDELSFATGAAISCGTGTAYNALRRMNLSGRDTLAVFGLGPVGLSAVQLGAAMGARVIALDVTPERRALAPEFGADAVLDPAADEPVATLKELTHGQGVDLALDCSGAEAARTAAIRATRTWGTVCFVGEGGSVTIDVSRDMIRKQLTVIG